MGAFRAEEIARIRAQVGAGRVICGLSGGVDSSVAAVLIHEAIGDQLTCIYVDHGLMRAGESEQVVATFRDRFNIRLVHRDASGLFLGQLSGVLAYWQNDTIAKALVLIAIVILIRFRPQGLFVAKVRT